VVRFMLAPLQRTSWLSVYRNNNDDVSKVSTNEVAQDRVSWGNFMMTVMNIRVP
jgi:hypothetical protein